MQKWLRKSKRQVLASSRTNSYLSLQIPHMFLKSKCNPLPTWFVYDCHKTGLEYFFGRWWIPNLIIGLSEWWAPNYPLRTQETVSGYCWPVVQFTVNPLIVLPHFLQNLRHIQSETDINVWLYSAAGSISWGSNSLKFESIHHSSGGYWDSLLETVLEAPTILLQGVPSWAQ